MKTLALMFMSAGLAACAGKTPAPVAAPAAPDPVWSTAGSIFHDGQGLALFSDSKAYRVGDVLTVVLSEKTQARSSAATSTAKDDEITLDAPTVMGAPVTLKGRSVLSTSIEGARKFSGSGDSTQSNQLSGYVSVTVRERLANGNLLVEGEKRLQLNQGDEVIRIRGIVRPIDIAPDNSVDSARLADARISYTGRGSLGGANRQGWLSRLFSSGWMPF